MCIAILKPQGKVISKERLQICFENNKDGAGFLYNQDSALVLNKGFFNFEDFYSAYQETLESISSGLRIYRPLCNVDYSHSA